MVTYPIREAFMKAWIFAACAALAACVSPAPSDAQSNSGSSAAPPSYSDARSGASDADIRDARRAYRSACQQRSSGDYCECMTASMAQILAPADLRIATAALAGGSVGGSAEARARIEAARSQSDAACASYRR